jgi:hypothetical protein|tara:strand:+ start:1288 stop:1704 length:417 start_codon:yes stop_codon:yes gene_type:complete
MRLYNIYGKLQSKNVTKYLIDWDSKSRSKLQFKAKQFFKTVWSNQVIYEEFPVFGSKMKVDFLNATKKIAIEVNGPQHSSFNKFFHNNSRMNYLESLKRDHQKSLWLEQNNFTLIELEKKEVDNLNRDLIYEKFNVLI